MSKRVLSLLFLALSNDLMSYHPPIRLPRRTEMYTHHTFCLSSRRCSRPGTERSSSWLHTCPAEPAGTEYLRQYPHIIC